MGPPSFITCFVCQRGFGSQSIHIHVPTCLEKWHQENNKKRKPERSKPPSPPPMYPVSVQLRPANHRPLSAGGGKRARPGTARLDKPKVLNATLCQEMDMSKLTRDMVQKMHKPITNSDLNTTTTNNTTTTTQGSGANTTSSDYSSGDFTSSSSSPLGGDHKQSGEEEEEEDGGILSSGSGGDSESEESTANKKAARPGTMKLPRPSRHIGVPIIIPTAAKAPPRRGTITIIKSYPPKQRRKNLEEVFTGPPRGMRRGLEEAAPLKDKAGIPQPCLTCGKEQNPERFHSHPTHMTKFKAKDKPGNKDQRHRKTNHNNNNSTKKRIVTKPLPLMYKSGGKTVLGKVDGRKKNNNNHQEDQQHNNNTETNKKNKSMSVENLVGVEGRERRRRQQPLKTRSADNSPTRAKTKGAKNRLKENLEPTSEPEDASTDAAKSLPLSHFIKQSKASMISKEGGEGGQGGPKQDFTIDFFEKESKNVFGTVEESPFHNPFRDKRLNSPLGRRGSQQSSGGGSPSKFGGMTNSVRGAAPSRQNSQARGRGNSRQANVVRRPSMLDERPVEEPSDDEELDDIVILKPLPKVADSAKTEDTFKEEVSAPRRMGAIVEESSSGKGGGRPGTTPRSAMLTCYICGREFGTRSLPIHEPKCLEKWERDNALLPRELQRAAPQRPDHPLTRDEWNEFAWTASQAQLVPCWCGRTFFPERLAVHQKGCKPPPGKEGKGRPGSTTSQYELPPSATLGSAKPTVSCYICGREFGSRSIGIHEPQCLNKWKKENSQLPAELQRGAPKKPEIVYDDDGRVDRVAMEQAAWQSHLETLVKCPNCPRTFLPDRLGKHQKACRGEGG